MLLELLTLFKNFVLRIATVCSAETQPTASCDLVSSAVYYIIQSTELTMTYSKGMPPTHNTEMENI